MIPLTITFEEARTPQRFAHIASADGILGHARELRNRIPVGTWVSVQPEYQPTVERYLERCGFQFMGYLRRNGGFDALLQKVSD